MIALLAGLAAGLAFYVLAAPETRIVAALAGWVAGMVSGGVLALVLGR